MVNMMEYENKICPICGRRFKGKMVYCTLECLYKSKYGRGDYEFQRKILDYMILNPNISARKIAKQFGVNKSVTERLSLFTDRKFILKKVNEDFFEVIDSEEKAYWLGFMYADGYVSKRGSSSTVELCLASKDVSHLYKFKKSLNSNIEPKLKISKCNNKKFEAYRFTVNRGKMFNDLVEKGCIENKSLKIKFKADIFKDKKLIRHFFRGYVDGDGCLGYYEDKQHPNRKKIIAFNLLGTHDILKNFYKHLDENKIDYGKNSIYKGKDSKKNIFIISKRTHKAKNIIKFLYSDCNIYLDRKYNKYLEIIS